MRKYYGPFTIHVDEDNQVVRVTLERVGPKCLQLLEPEI